MINKNGRMESSITVAAHQYISYKSIPCNFHIEGVEPTDSYGKQYMATFFKLGEFGFYQLNAILPLFQMFKITTSIKMSTAYYIN